MFARIERWTNENDPTDVSWRSISKDNLLTIYGKDENSRIVNPADRRRIFGWLICETRHDEGSAILYEYKPEDGAGTDLTQVHERNRGDRDSLQRQVNRYIRHIRYGNRCKFCKGPRSGLPTNSAVSQQGCVLTLRLGQRA